MAENYQEDAQGRQIKISRPPYIEIVHRPFAKGALTADGTQYGTEVTGITHTAYVNVEEVTIHQPAGYTLVEIEFSLVGATKSSSTAKHVKFKWQAGDDGSNYANLTAIITRAADASAYADTTYSGIYALAGNFLGTSSTFVVSFAVTAEDATETASAKIKSSSTITCRYQLA